MQLIVTRPRAQALAAVQELRDRGVDAVALPLLGIEPLIAVPVDGGGAPRDEAGGAQGSAHGDVHGGAPGGINRATEGGAHGGAAGEARAALLSAWARLREYRLAMFVSANAVVHFFAAAPLGATWPTQTLAGSTGPGTTAALLAAGVPAACVREPAAAGGRLDSEALWLVLRPLGWQGARALIVRGEHGRDWLAETLHGAGAHVDLLAAYRRTLPSLNAEEAALLAAVQAHPAQFAWHFSSSEAARHLPLLAPGGTWRAARAYASHERIAQAARDIGFADVHLLVPGTQALVRACLAAQDSTAASEGRAEGPSPGPSPGAVAGPYVDASGRLAR